MIVAKKVHVGRNIFPLQVKRTPAKMAINTLLYAYFMENICDGLNQIHIILTSIVGAINKVLKKVEKCLGT